MPGISRIWPVTAALAVAAAAGYLALVPLVHSLQPEPTFARPQVITSNTVTVAAVPTDITSSGSDKTAFVKAIPKPKPATPAAPSAGSAPAAAGGFVNAPSTTRSNQPSNGGSSTPRSTNRSVGGVGEAGGGGFAGGDTDTGGVESSGSTSKPAP